MSSSSSSSFEGLGELIQSVLDDSSSSDSDSDPFNQLVQSVIFASPSSAKPRKKRRVIRRDHQESYNRLYNDYFAEDPVFTEQQFRRRFRMRKHLFLRIVDALGQHSEYFQMRSDGLGRPGISPLIKCTVAIRMLAYGMAVDVIDEYLKIGESTALECLIRFARGVIILFGDEYLRKPTQADFDRLLAIGDARDFPGMLGSIDCMHWEWKNCPIAWKASFAKGNYKVPTLVLEAVASADLWIWHAFFGMPGSLNDINVLRRSPIFQDSYQDHAPRCEYMLNGKKYNIGYYLSDGIYPKWATFVKSIPVPEDPKHKLFAQRQEAARKDVERAFGVLQARFTIVRGPSRFMQTEDMGLIMKACVILHNMIVEDERDSYNFSFEYEYEDVDGTTPPPNVEHDYFPNYADYVRISSQVQDPEQHKQLQKDLIEEIWKRQRAREQ